MERWRDCDERKAQLFCTYSFCEGWINTLNNLREKFGTRTMFEEWRSFYLFPRENVGFETFSSEFLTWTEIIVGLNFNFT